MLGGWREEKDTRLPLLQRVCVCVCVCVCVHSRARAMCFISRAVSRNILDLEPQFLAPLLLKLLDLKSLSRSLARSLARYFD